MPRQKKIRNKNSGFVYSTNPDELKPEDQSQENYPLAPENQVLRIHLERKSGGKFLSVVKGFVGNKIQLKELSQTLKKHCGTGGSVKEGNILVQGDVREKILDYLLSKGYKAKLSGG